MINLKKDLLSVDEWAKREGVPRRTVYWWIETNRIPYETQTMKVTRIRADLTLENALGKDGYFFRRTPLVKRAGDMARLAIKWGKVKKPDTCESCNKPNKRILAHHDSYLKKDWIRVRFLCPECHSNWHKNNVPVYPKGLHYVQPK